MHMEETGGEPKYVHVKSQLLHLILETDAFSGHCLPSERVLGETFGVSRITIRRALSELELEGFLYRVQGKGAFVRDDKIPQPLAKLSSFSEDMASRRMDPGSRILALETVPAGRFIAGKLALQPEDNVVMLKRLRLADNEPMAIETCYLGMRIGTIVAEKMTDFRSLYRLITEECGVTLVSAEESIEVIPLKSYEMALLNAASAPYALFFTRLTFDDQGQPVEYVESKYRGDRYRLQTKLTFR